MSEKQAEIWLEIRLPEIATDADSQEAYNNLYSSSNISLRFSYYLWLVEMFRLQPGELYLDVSCGRPYLPQLARARGVVAHGLDLSHVVLQQGRQETGVHNLVTGNGQELPYADNTFDVISNIGSLEHYVDMKTAVSEMTRVLKPGGRAYVLVPNTFSILVNVWNAFRKGQTSIDNQPIQRYAARQEWQQLLESAGLVVTQTIKYEREWPRTVDDRRFYLTHPKELLRLLATPFVPLNLAFCFLFVAEKTS